jgi:hypothetical protein
MKKTFKLIAVFLLGLAWCAGAQESTGAEVKAVSFLGFDSADIEESGRIILSELVRREIAVAPGYALVERQDTDALLAEQELRLSSLFEGGEAMRVGRLLGAQYLLVGRIGKLGTLYIISLRLIDVERGEVSAAIAEEYLGPIEDLRKPVRIAAQRILGVPGIEIKQGEYISIDTDPPGVAVYVNGLFEGNGPVVVRVPKPGKYAVKLSSEGYKPWSQSVSVEPDATYFLKARLLQQDKAVDERVRALQDGRSSLLTFLTLYAAGASEALLYSLGSENARLYIGLPLVTAPLAFFGALKLTENEVMNGGRSFMIVSSMLWGSSWGVAAGLVFGLDGAAGGEGFNPAFAGLSVAGGLLYGGISYALTAGIEPFPSARTWLYNLGSVLGAFLGLGVPYVLGAESPGIIYAGMLSGSLVGSATALWLTRDFSEGRNVGNLAMGPLLDIDAGTGARLGLPLPALGLTRIGSAERLALHLPLLSLRY